LNNRWLPSDFREGVRETIAEVQPRRMTALAEVHISLAGDMRLFFSNRLDDDSRPPEESVKLAATLRLRLNLHHDGRFHKIGGGHAARFRLAQRARIHFGIGLVE
jgi:hypothetical protein